MRQYLRFHHAYAQNVIKILEMLNKHSLATTLFPLNPKYVNKHKPNSHENKNMVTDVSKTVIYRKYIHIFAMALALIIHQRRQSDFGKRWLGILQRSW